MGLFDVIFGVVFLGCDSEELEKVMFLIMNMVVIRSVLYGIVLLWLWYM